MSVELKRNGWEYWKILNTPLLQSGELPSASEILSPEKIDRHELAKLWQFAYDYTRARKFIAVAFTQFRSDTLAKLNLRTDFRRVIYFTNSEEFAPNIHDLLVINPQFSKNKNNQFISMEGCGSIENDCVGEVVSRCAVIETSSFVWKGGMDGPKLVQMPLFGLSSFIYQHELKHLDGEDTSFKGNGLLDFSDPTHPGWKGYEDRRQEIWNDLHGPSAKHLKWKEWLVERNGKTIIVNKDGNYIRDFKRASSF